jgi:hypothetical protein
VKELLLQLLPTLLTVAKASVLVSYAWLGAKWLYLHTSKQSLELKQKRIDDVKVYAHDAYLIVSDLSLRTGNKVLDKVALGLGYLDQALQNDGKDPLTLAEQNQAKLHFTALSGAEKLTSSLAKDAAPMLIPPENPAPEPLKVSGSPS